MLCLLKLSVGLVYLSQQKVDPKIYIQTLVCSCSYSTALVAFWKFLAKAVELGLYIICSINSLISLLFYLKIKRDKDNHYLVNVICSILVRWWSKISHVY